MFDYGYTNWAEMPRDDKTLFKKKRATNAGYPIPYSLKTNVVVEKYDHE